jgi:hypothetical protein
VLRSENESLKQELVRLQLERTQDEDELKRLKEQLVTQETSNCKADEIVRQMESDCRKLQDKAIELN